MILESYDNLMKQAVMSHACFEEISIDEMLLLATAYCRRGNGTPEFHEVLAENEEQEACFYVLLAQGDAIAATRLWQVQLLAYCQDQIEIEFNDRLDRARAWKESELHAIIRDQAGIGGR